MFSARAPGNPIIFLREFLLLILRATDHTCSHALTVIRHESAGFEKKRLVALFCAAPSAAIATGKDRSQGNLQAPAGVMDQRA